MLKIKIDFYYVLEEYIAFLKEAEIKKRGFTTIPNVTYSNSSKFVYGAVLNINEISYFVPVSSYKKKKEDNILICTNDKINSVKGSLRFNYMLPIPYSCLKRLSINDLPNFNEKERIRKELAFCRKNREKISMQAKKTYKRVVNNASDELLSNSCDFPLLEQKCLEYCREHDLELPRTLPFPEYSTDTGDAHTAEKENPYKLSGGRKR